MSNVVAAQTPDAGTGAPPAHDAEFEAFYRAEVDRVYRALAVTLGDPHLAREATDEAMARAYVHWARVARADNPGGWVFRVGLNWATSWWRKVRRERPLPDHADRDANHEVVAPPDPAATVAVAALGRLALEQRAVVVCRVLLDMTIAETAAALGIAEGTVKSRQARGLAGLRKALQEQETEECSR